MNCYSDLVRHAIQKGIKPIHVYASDISEQTALVKKRRAVIVSMSKTKDEPALLSISGLPWDYVVPLLPDGTPLRINQFIKSQGINT